jgi:hypothetical protein
MILAVGERNIASLAAIGTIVEPVHGEANVLLRLAEAAVLLAGALPLGLFALAADRLRHAGYPSARN